MKINIKYYLLVFTFIPCLLFSQANIENIKEHFDNIINTKEYRNYRNVKTLDTVASYIKNHLEIYADSTYYQNFIVDGKTYKNIIGVFGKDKKETIVIGAHYDVCGDQDGADDNASGVVGILELARLFHNKDLKYRIELVGYTLEEPPFFRTKSMGSYVHAKSLFDSKTDVYGMLSLEMIGYFDDHENSQNFPIGILSWFYGNRGNFITVVNKWSKKGKFARKFTKKFKKQKKIKAKSFSGPKSIEGVDWSDHLNYWTFGYSASMITDTAANRNKNYHRKSDKVSTLNLEKMARVIDAIEIIIISLK